MKTRMWLIAGLIAALSMDCAAQKKKNPGTYIGYVYPAGGRQGETVTVRAGGQKLTGVYGAVVSGEGADAKLLECRPKLGNQDTRLIKEQLKLLKKGKNSPENDKVSEKIKDRAQTVMGDYVRNPANASISSLVLVEVSIDKDAKPGRREIRLMTSKGMSNPLPFYIGQLPEISRKPMKTATFQTLGKEHLALRKRPDDEVEMEITLPCTLNGQVASGEVNRYRFQAKKGQKLVISTLARQLVPYIADAVPGWFQPILKLQDANGKEVAFNDDYRFKPDPTILYEAEKDGEYILTINDAIFRGREDFVYRITIGETPFLTGIFPLGGKTGRPAATRINGWNLNRTKLYIPDENDTEGVHSIAANRKDILSNHVPFSLDTLPERLEREDGSMQLVTLPIIINGRADEPGDQDSYRFKGKKSDVIVAEVYARRLDSPLDSILQLTDDAGNLIAFNDDHSDPGSGLDTHHADSYLRVKLPEDGMYHIHLTDTARRGSSAYAYRLRLSKPRPDFALRTVPSSLNFKNRGSASVEVFAIRKDGYDGPIRLRLSDPPEGFTAKEITLPAGKEKIKFSVKTSLVKTDQPIELNIEGEAKVGKREIVRRAVPSEDWMQAFLWRHLVPSQQLLAQVYNQSMLPKPDRTRPALPAELAELNRLPYKEIPKDKKQIRQRVRQIGRLYDEWLITDDFYRKKVDEYREFVATGQPKQ